MTLAVPRASFEVTLVEEWAAFRPPQKSVHESV